ncbi:MAG TPA: FKBP-type peptidyl-prolyl cis-trans isomerase [Candidatus Angelobacter sp.]|jgi:FKBP-type peptidyl-prolyl cis-trans isomerase|nr:FKBP-type peptidyl-prolyl cis-trans isomerase [Candidatus Angelobacter sp.]
MHKNTAFVWTLILCLAAAGAALAQGTSAPKKPAGTAAAPKASPSPTPKASSSPTASPSPAANASPFKTPKERISYALGMSLGTNISKNNVDVDQNLIEQGLKDAMAGKPQMTEDQARAAFTELQGELRAKQEAEQKVAAEKNKKEGADFLAANKTKEGVKTTASGLQYKVIKEGTGPKPTATDKVEVNYRGTLINGKEFDSSYKRGQPATFPVGNVIKGWTEALQLMPVGSKWELYVPADLAYGDRAAGPDIGPNSTLIFEVELLSIVPSEEKKPAAEPPKPEGEKKPEAEKKPPTGK